MNRENNLKILGFLKNKELSDKRVSCTLGLLNEHLNNRDYVRQIIDTEIYGFRNKMNLVRSFDFNINKWMFKHSLNVKTKILRSKWAEKQLFNYKGDCNACFQVGSEFALHDIENIRHLPKFSYHDNNLMALLKSSKFIYDIPIYIEKAFAFENEIYRNLDGIFTMTEYVRKSFIEDFSVPEEKVHCIGFGTNMRYQNIDRSYDGRTILFVAKDSFEKKGGKVLLNAFKIVREQIKDARLLLVGQNLNVKQDGVEVVGFIDKRYPQGEQKLSDLYKCASLFVMPSYDEAAGNVFLEAMAHKTPCIGADRGSTPEILSGNGCGLVVEPGNETALGHLIIELLEAPDQLNQMGQSAFSSIENTYNWETVCKKAVSIMETLI